MFTYLFPSDHDSGPIAGGGITSSSVTTTQVPVPATDLSHILLCIESSQGNTSFYLRDDFRRDKISPSTFMSSINHFFIGSEFQSLCITV